MRKEYDELLCHCRELSKVVSAQGQEIYCDGSRIDELDHYIMLTTQRADQLHSQNRASNYEQLALVQDESNKLLVLNYVNRKPS